MNLIPWKNKHEDRQGLGVDPRELQIDVTGDVLTLRGEKKHEKEEKRKNYHYVERHYGNFQRRMCPATGFKLKSFPHFYVRVAPPEPGPFPSSRPTGTMSVG